MQKTGTSRSVLEPLQRIPGVGPSLAQDLVDLGICSVPALRRRNPERLYEQLCTLRGQHQCRCVLYVFRCAVYFASEESPDPERLKWWNWKDPQPTPQPRKHTNRKVTISRTAHGHLSRARPR